MGEIENYKIDIVGRTKEILIHYFNIIEKDKREVTFLMNCLLGIIIAITETEKKSRKLLRGNINDEFIENIPERIGFIQSKELHQDLTANDLTEITLNVNHKSELLGKDKLWLLMKIRNSIAHQNIIGINNNGNWVGVRLWNVNNSKKDFEIVFSIDELKNFAIDLADKFKQAYN